MSLPVILRHGTKAQMDAYGPMQVGEVGFCTDQGLIYASDGTTNHLIGRTISGSVDPSTPRPAGMLYINTSSSGIWFSNGSEWLSVGTSHLSGLSGTLDDVQDGSVYQRVAATEVDSSGRVTQISDGTHTVTAQTARDHIDDSTIHRSINDASTSSTSLWSSQKITDQLTAVVNGVSWQDSVKSLSTDIPGSPLNSDRYIIPASGTGVWSTHLLNVTEFITASGGWVYYPPSEGMASWVEDQDAMYIYNGSAWVKMSSVEQHNNMSGLQGGQSNQYYHLNTADYTALTTNRTQTIVDTVSGMVSAGSQSGIVVTEFGGALNFTVNASSATPSTTTSGSSYAGVSTNFSRDDHQHKIGIHPFFGTEHALTGAVDGYLVGTNGSSLTWVTQIDGGTF